ncbi:MAG TPA: histidine--tRNA ligase [Candidatus Omnitrophota bacterium]|nr:histidine--tRNA ligase [Candidatus Omnitrophota bacterium]
MAQQVIQRLKGTADIFSPEAERWQWIEECTRHFFEAYGFGEVRTPLIEPLELFVRSVGEGSDIVHKQMYAFEDRGGRQIALRPEMTASVARCAIENGLLRKEKTLRFFYQGPMFRAERPQKGRQRQFHQLGAEILNAKPVEADIEILLLIDGLFRSLKISGFTIRVNHLGCADDRGSFQEKLRDYFSGTRDALCEDCRFRTDRNVLRVLDCKMPSCQPLIEKAPAIRLCPRCEDEYGKIRDELKARNIEIQCLPRLVRGLDYYTGLVFEVNGGGALGAQDAIAAGGRYDELIRSLGGNDAGAVGFAAGVERILLAQGESQCPGEDDVYAAILDRNFETERYYGEVIDKLYKIGRRVRRDVSAKTLRDHFAKAEKTGVRYMLILGEKEVKTRSVTVKDLKSKSQKELSWEEWPVFLTREFLKGEVK